ncbi:MAG TPA: HAD family hydrolase [Candidatus Saccharimonadales bacterium]|nr:HAD family hydrolase [Candidatus Saccharimonadales bacterium]
MSSAGEGRSHRIDGVLFDYGETLVEFVRPLEALAEAEGRILALLAASGRVVPSTATVRAVQDRVEREVIDHQRSGALEEIDLAAASFRAYADAGLTLDAALLDEILRVEQEAWWHGAHPDPEAVPLLDALRGRGVRVGLCSNAPYRIESLRAQLTFLGLDRHLDAAVFSAEVGWRKPSPSIFEAALRALGTEADRTVMVGDSEAADIAGAHAAGLRAVLISRSEQGGSSESDAVIAALRELPGALRNMGIYLE